jgi:endogenous inhibitor of DNA gyrase (YacG/DUF329 family)
MTHAREGERRPCAHCGTPTVFVRTVYGPRGGRLRVEDCCPECGEQPARRDAAAERRAA